MFLKYYNIPFGTPVRYDVVVENGILVIDLNQEGREAISNRSRAEREGSFTRPLVPRTDSQMFKDEGVLR